MTEQTPTGDEAGRQDDETAVVDDVPGSPSDRVREVVGRRGYDEAEDEAASEDEEH